MVQVKMVLPEESFRAFMEPLKDGDAYGEGTDAIERDENCELKPTKVTQTRRCYHYKIIRPMVTDRFFNLAEADLGPGPPARAGKGSWRRCHGGAHLCLADAVGKSGRLGNKISMVAGSLLISYIVPKRRMAFPILTLRYYVLTVDHNGNITWPTNFNTMAKGLLRKLARQKIDLMLKDEEYPIDPAMMNALTSQGHDTNLNLRAIPRDPPVLGEPIPQRVLTHA